MNKREVLEIRKSQWTMLQKDRYNGAVVAIQLEKLDRILEALHILQECDGDKGRWNSLQNYCQSVLEKALEKEWLD